MKTTQGIYNERLNRLSTALKCGTPDRVPVVIFGDTFCAKVMKVPLSKFFSDVKFAHEVIMAAYKELGDFDGAVAATTSPWMTSVNWLSKIKVPGIDLPDNVIVQVLEQEIMKEEDYDTIISKGWDAFFLDVCLNRLGNPLEKLQPMIDFMPTAVKNIMDAGYVCFLGGAHNAPIDDIAGPRSLVSFIKDIRRIPDKVEAALEVICEHRANVIKKELSGQVKLFSTFLGNARGSTGFLNPKLCERFSWKYTKKIIDVIVECGGTAYLHWDGDWLGALPRLAEELPKNGHIIMGADSTNDIFKYREILGDKICIYGDVPAALLSLGTPDETYEYCVKLCNGIGPSGFILAAGCSIPYNAKLENIKAMIEATKA